MKPSEYVLGPSSYERANGWILKKSSLIPDSDATTEAERIVLKTEAARRGYRLFSLHDFVERVFFTAAYEGEATVAGFNLPFDLSRLAIKSRRAATGLSSEQTGRGYWR